MDDLPPLLVERDVNGEWMTFSFVIIFDINYNDFNKIVEILRIPIYLVKNQYPWTNPDSRFGNRRPLGG